MNVFFCVKPRTFPNALCLLMRLRVGCLGNSLDHGVYRILGGRSEANVHVLACASSLVGRVEKRELEAHPSVCHLWHGCLHAVLTRTRAKSQGIVELRDHKVGVLASLCQRISK